MALLILRPFNFITISRLDNKVNIDYTSYLTIFLYLSKYY